jgi:hypothetical protein
MLLQRSSVHLSVRPSVTGPLTEVSDVRARRLYV